MSLKKSFLLLILLLISLPTFFIKVKKINKVFSINENRYRHSFPKTFSPLDADTYYRELEIWYNDKFAFRDFLIRLQHQIDFSLFNYNKEVTVDNNGYLYYRNVTENEQVYNERCVIGGKDSQLAKTCDAFIKIKDFLAEQNIALKIIIPPQKNEVICGSEYFQNVRRPEKNAYSVMEDYYQENGLKGVYIPILETLREKNLSLPVFYRCDFHWNDYGAAIGFSEVLNSYANDIGLGRILNPSDDFQVLPLKEYSKNNQLDNLSPLFFRLPYSITVKNNKNIVYSPSNSGIDKIACWENKTNPLLKGSALFIGESYTPPALFDLNGTYSGMSGIFEKTYFCHWNDSKGILTKIPPDVRLVVLERIESSAFIYTFFENLLASD